MRGILLHRGELVITFLIFCLAGAVFVFFKSFFDAGPDGLTTEILAALLGSILTVMITMLVIKRQGSIEQAQELAATSKTKVFEKKLEMFRQFIKCYVESAADGSMTCTELQTLEELALTISLFTKDVPIGSSKTDLGEELCRFVLQLELFGLQMELQEKDFALYDRHFGNDGDSQSRRMISFLHILRGMKVELGIAQSEEAELDSRALEVRECVWAGKLLDYRGYREGSHK